MSNREKKIAIIVTILDVILIGVIAFFYFQLDRNEPKIQLPKVVEGENKIYYEEGMDWNELLVGVTATDDVDADVTNRIVIEKIVDNKNDDAVVVYYAVCDKAGNVAKASMAFEKGTNEKQ